MIRRKIIDRVGLFNEKLSYPYTVYEDWEYGVRIRKAGYKLLVDGRVILEHMHRSSSTRPSSRRLMAHFKNYFRMIYSYVEPRKGFALYSILKHSRRLQVEYTFYASWLAIMPVLCTISMWLAVPFILVTLLIATIYYALTSHCAFKYLNYKLYKLVFYAFLRGVVSLATRVLRALSLPSYFVTKAIKTMQG